ncbi:MAG: Rab family GTPase, partial [Chthoniobacterales bacterium]
AIEVQRRVAEALGPVPFVVALNKADLVAQWEMSDARMADLESRGWKYMKTSARDGAAVDEIFTELGQMMMQSK